MKKIKLNVLNVLNVLWNKINNKYWWVKNFLFNRYDLIRTGLDKGGWHDTDKVMLYGMMNLLVIYVEEEYSAVLEQEFLEKKTFICEEERLMVENAIAENKEMKEIYNWWKNYPNREKEIEAKYEEYGRYRRGKRKIEKECASIEIRKMEDKLKEEEQEMLIRLVKIRGCLWT